MTRKILSSSANAEDQQRAAALGSQNIDKGDIQIILDLDARNFIDIIGDPLPVPQPGKAVAPRPGTEDDDKKDLKTSRLMFQEMDRGERAGLTAQASFEDHIEVSETPFSSVAPVNTADVLHAGRTAKFFCTLPLGSVSAPIHSNHRVFESKTQASEHLLEARQDAIKSGVIPDPQTDQVSDRREPVDSDDEEIRGFSSWKY